MSLVMVDIWSTGNCGSEENRTRRPTCPLCDSHYRADCQIERNRQRSVGGVVKEHCDSLPVRNVARRQSVYQRLGGLYLSRENCGKRSKLTLFGPALMIQPCQVHCALSNRSEERRVGKECRSR